MDGERVRTLPDLLAPGVRLLFVGYNPSVRAARLGRYYAGRNNRFWELLAAAGLTPRRFAFPEDGLLPTLGIGVTDLVKRPTRSAAELTRAELRAGAERIRRIVAELRPRVVCYNGKGVYLAAAGVPRAAWGLQPDSLFPGTADFVAPSPSGLATISFAEKVRRYTELRETLERLAGCIVTPAIDPSACSGFREGGLRVAGLRMTSRCLSERSHPEGAAAL